MAGASTVLTPSTRLADLPGVGPSRGRALGRLGLVTVADLLRHLPSRYERVEAEATIDKLAVGTIAGTRGMLSETRWIPSRGRGRGRFEALLVDEAGQLRLTWFNASYLRDRLHPGAMVQVQGKVGEYDGQLQLINPTWRLLNDDRDAGLSGDAGVGGGGGGGVGGRSDGGYEGTEASVAKLRPVYPAAEDLSSGVIEKLVSRVLPAVREQIVDPLPEGLMKQLAMPTLAEAFTWAHQPGALAEAQSARRRLAYNELLLLQLGIELKRQYNRSKLRAPALRWSEQVDGHIRARFPFALTESQETVIGEIAADLQRSQPMNRLLQGDVGAGKTVVALYAVLLAIANRKQGAIMAPTELLAEQHFASISRMLAGSNVRITLLTAGQTASGSSQRKAQLQQIAAGEYDLVIGTQALVAGGVRFHDLAVVVVDEQHRFGVLQRAAFRGSMTSGGGGGDGAEKADDGGAGDDAGAGGSAGAGDGSGDVSGDDAGLIDSPHYLVMTATPIPRTLSLTVFGDLDVSTISGLPPGRPPIKTRTAVPAQASHVYQTLATRVSRGEQGYVVVPAIEDSNGSGGRVDDAGAIKAVRSHAKHLSETWLSEARVAAVHGKLKRSTREAIMDRFRRGVIDVLVATTVIEVGVDVPNATMMVVEQAERFGLAQLHQLRGRIGRGQGGPESLCVLIGEPTTEDAQQRLRALVETTDGFAIAEQDLAIRGMGDFFGTRQHGLPPLRIASIPADMDLLHLARRDAGAMVREDPTLADPSRAMLKKLLLKQYGEMLGVIDVG